MTGTTTAEMVTERTFNRMSLIEFLLQSVDLVAPSLALLFRLLPLHVGQRGLEMLDELEVGSRELGLDNH